MRRFTLIVVFVTMLFSGCKQSEGPAKAAQESVHAHGTPKDWKFTLPAGNAADGRKLFVEAECHKCHEVKGEHFPNIVKEKGDVGPELSQMAGAHPYEFFAESIVNPNAVIDHDAKERGYLGDDGRSKMPDYNETFTIRQLADLATYLISLKGEGGHKH